MGAAADEEDIYICTFCIRYGVRECIFSFVYSWNDCVRKPFVIKRVMCETFYVFASVT
jgi:hypothetical protein